MAEFVSVIKKSCSDCGNLFECTVSNKCWCKAYPNIVSIDENHDCYCPACYAGKIHAYIATQLQQKSIDEVVTMAAACRNQNELLEQVDYTIENGNYVFTAWYLLKRGYCCGNGCRHCPYPKETGRQ